MTNQHPPHVSGTIQELVWVDDSDSPCTRAYAPAIGGRMIVVELDPGSGEYSAGIDLSGLCFRLIQSTYDDGYGIKYSAPEKFPSIDAAKAAAQADYEARIKSAIIGDGDDAIQPDLQRAASEPVACSADHLDMATPECPGCGAFQEATPSSAPASVAEAAQQVALDCAQSYERTGNTAKAEACRFVAQQIAALRALSEESK